MLLSPSDDGTCVSRKCFWVIVMEKVILRVLYCILFSTCFLGDGQIDHDNRWLLPVLETPMGAFYGALMAVTAEAIETLSSIESMRPILVQHSCIPFGFCL